MKKDITKYVRSRGKKKQITVCLELDEFEAVGTEAERVNLSKSQFFIALFRAWKDGMRDFAKQEQEQTPIDPLDEFAK